MHRVRERRRTPPRDEKSPTNQHPRDCFTSIRRAKWPLYLPSPPPCSGCTLCVVIAKFHYTGPTGPARTFFAARVSEKLRWVRARLRQSPRESGRVRVVEFSLKRAGDPSSRNSGGRTPSVERQLVWNDDNRRNLSSAVKTAGPKISRV